MPLENVLQSILYIVGPNVSTFLFNYHLLSDIYNHPFVIGYFTRKIKLNITVTKTFETRLQCISTNALIVNEVTYAK